jgi:predicted ATPase
MSSSTLIQQATYNSLLEDRRRQMHRQVARSIEQLFEGRLEPFHAMLAHHYASGRREKTRGICSGGGSG